MNPNNDIKPVVIFSGTILEAQIVKSLLNNSEIEVFLNDEINGTLTPWITASGGYGAVKLIVSNLDYDKAKLIVDEYEKNHNTK